MVGWGFFPFPLIYLAFLPMVRSRAGNSVAVAFIVGILLLCALFVWIFYLCSRLQFAFFDMVLNRGEFVTPAWRKYARPSRRWTLFKLLFGMVFTALFAAPIASYALHILPLLTSMKPNQPPPPQLFAAVFAGYGLVLLCFGSFGAVSLLLSDFIVPSLALEDTSLSEAFLRMGRLIRNEPGQFAAYAFTKIGLGIVAYIGATFALEITLLLSALIIGALAFAIGFALHMIGVPILVLTGLGIVLAIAFYLFFLGYVLLLFLGPVLTFLQAYTLYFLAGRYPLLGDLLQASEPPPPDYLAPASYLPPSPLPPPFAG